MNQVLTLSSDYMQADFSGGVGIGEGSSFFMPSEKDLHVVSGPGDDVHFIINNFLPIAFDIKNIDQYYITEGSLVYANREEIDEFVKENKLDVDGAIKITRKYFSENLELKLVYDEDAEDSDKTLFIYVKTEKSISEANSILNKLDTDLFDRLKIDPFLLNINLEFY